MTFILVFLLAAFFSGIGVLPPGMLNITAASISINKSLTEAKKFIVGASILVAVQSFVGFYFSVFLKNNPQITQNLKLVGSIIFVLLTIFFLGKGVQNKINNNKIETKPSHFKVSSFVHGLLLSSINVFPVPYYSFLSLYFSAFITNFFTSLSGFFFIIGAVSGTGLVYFLYAILFKKMENKVQFFVKNVNFIIALITGIVATITIYNLE